MLAIAGDFVPSQARSLVAKVFADVPARPVATSSLTAELPQRGERRTHLLGPVDRQYFELAFPSPAASDRDFPAFLVLQEILSGGSGVNLRQSDWAGTPAVTGSLLFGATDDVATWLPPTHDPFLFTISGSIAAKADREPARTRHRAANRQLGDRPTVQPRLAKAQAAVVRALAEDVQTTEDAAHQLAFFEGIGALDPLLDMPRRIAAVTAADVQRVARTYLVPDRLTVGWMVPGNPSRAVGARRSATRRRPPRGGGADRPRESPQLRRLSGGLPAIVQSNPLSNTATVELLLSAPVEAGAHPEDLPGLDAVIRSGTPDDLAGLVNRSAGAVRQRRAVAEAPSEDPATRLQQLIVAQTGPHAAIAPKPLAVIVSGNIAPDKAFGILERQLGKAVPAKLDGASPRAARPEIVRERIAKPLSQGAIGYVVEGPRPVLAKHWPGACCCTS